MPRCREDGSYAPIQCFDNNQCWCVDNLGISISQVVQGRPNCSFPKENQKRSSPASNIAPKKKCTSNDRATFNTAFITIFSNEFVKLKINNGPLNDYQIIDWKFKQLDANKNNILESNEYQGLKKIAKMVIFKLLFIMRWKTVKDKTVALKVVKPKRCGRRFGKYCDTNKDSNLSREEFHQCLDKNVQRRK